MKFLIFILISFTFFLHSFAQGVIELPRDPESNKISYTAVVKLDSTISKDAIYFKAIEWMAKSYKSSKDVIQLSDKESGKIIGKALIQVYHRYLGSDQPSGYINYTINISCKDGKYKYSFTDFYHTKQPGTAQSNKGPIESFYGQKPSYDKMYDYYLQTVNSSIISLVNDLIKTMKEISNNSSDNNW